MLLILLIIVFCSRFKMHDHQHQVYLMKHERMLINLLKRQRRRRHQLHMYVTHPD